MTVRNYTKTARFYAQADKRAQPTQRRNLAIVRAYRRYDRSAGMPALAKRYGLNLMSIYKILHHPAHRNQPWSDDEDAPRPTHGATAHDGRTES